MGSYAYTCAVSKLPIRAGDQIRYLLVTENPYEDEGVAHRATRMIDWWFPRTFPITAEYNDYGSIQNAEEGPAQDIWLEALAKDLVPVGWGENLFHDLPTSTDMTFEDFMKALMKGRVMVRREFSLEDLAKPLRVSHVMIREDVWQALLKFPLRDKWSGEKAPTLAQMKTEIRDYYRIRLAEMKTEVELNAQELEAASPAARAAHLLTAIAKLRRSMNLDGQPSATLWITQQEAIPYTIGLATHWELFLAKQLPVGEAERFLASVAEMAYMHQVLMHVRFLWMPSTSCGDQFGDFDKHSRFHPAMKKIASKLAKEDTE